MLVGNSFLWSCDEWTHLADSGVLGDNGGVVDGSSRGGAVDGHGLVNSGAGGGSEEDGEGLHFDCLEGIKYVWYYVEVVETSEIGI